MVTLQNSEDKEWVINPSISTESEACKGFFYGKTLVTIPPKSNTQYEIIYHPKKMTQKNSDGSVITHKGSLFFPLPNGTALLYRLVGTANEPEVESTIQSNVVAKKNTFIIIPVTNWLKENQRFNVSWELEGVDDQTTFIRGANIFDVAGDSGKDYKLNFLAYRGGLYKFTVNFKNQTTGEYIQFKVNATASEPDLLDKIELISCVRETAVKEIMIENPTDKEIEIPKSQFVFVNDTILIQPDVLKIPPKSERHFDILFRPLIVSE